jgi:hypothetical protein
VITKRIYFSKKVLQKVRGRNGTFKLKMVLQPRFCNHASASSGRRRKRPVHHWYCRKAFGCVYGVLSCRKAHDTPMVISNRTGSDNGCLLECFSSSGADSGNQWQRRSLSQPLPRCVMFVPSSRVAFVRHNGNCYHASNVNDGFDSHTVWFCFVLLDQRARCWEKASLA